MRLFDQFFGLLAIDIGDVYFQRDGQPKTSGIILADGDVRANLDIFDRRFVLCRDKGDGTTETGGVPAGEKLFRIGGTWFSGTAHFLRDRQVNFDVAVVGFRMAVTTGGGGGMGGVEWLESHK